MKTTVNNGKIRGSIKNEKSETPQEVKVNGLPTSKEFDGKAQEQKPKAEETTKPVVDTNGIEQPKVTEPEKKEEVELPVAKTEEPKAEPTKAEIREQLKEEKTPLNLDSTIKLIETLHRRKIQRDKLLDTISTLEAFEVAQLDDADDTDTNKLQRCELTIEDDKGNEFSTKNPFIINAVAQYVNRLCIDKLAEIEGGITLPA